MSGESLRDKLYNGNLASVLSDRTYNLSIGLSLVYGCVLSAILAYTMGDTMATVNPWLFCLLYLVLGFVAQFIAVSTDNVVVSFIAYNLIVAPTGLLLAMFVGTYTSADITISLITVATIVVVMTVLSTIFPFIFETLGRGLFISLLVGLIFEIISMILGYSGHLFDWFFVLLFSGYVGYDWYLAQNYPRTVSNAIRSSIALYLDIVNLFVRLLSIFGGRKSD